jgi:hypothetical protein
MLFEIHAAAGNELERVLGRNRTLAGDLEKEAEDGVRDFAAAEAEAELGFPGVKISGALFERWRFIDKVVSGPAEPIDSMSATGQRGRKEFGGKEEALGPDGGLSRRLAVKVFDG